MRRIENHLKELISEVWVEAMEAQSHIKQSKPSL